MMAEEKVGDITILSCDNCGEAEEVHNLGYQSVSDRKEELAASGWRINEHSMYCPECRY